MKAAINGVPSFSVLDGWWAEGCIEGVTGWSIGSKEIDPTGPTNHSRDATSLYDKLEGVILPLFYQNRDGFLDIMRHAIALNGSFFNTHRMLQQYVLKAYF
jgi:starch phosphorylase